MPSTYVAVAVNIVALSAEENTASASEKADVNTITSPIRTIKLLIKNSTSTVMVGIADDRTVTMTVLVHAIFLSE